MGKELSAADRKRLAELGKAMADEMTPEDRSKYDDLRARQLADLEDNPDLAM